MAANRFDQAQLQAFSDKELLAQLKRLVDAVANESDKWKNEKSWRQPTEEEYGYYRSGCYEAISKLFWEIANQIKIAPTEYYKDGNYEHDMRAYLDAHVHTNWIEAAISGDEVDDDDNHEDKNEEILIIVDSEGIPRNKDGFLVASIPWLPQ